MDFNPTAQQKARFVLEQIFADMDAQKRNREPKKRCYGKRAEFIAKYKLKGYDIAKREINEPFGKEVYKDEFLKKWIEEEK